jgi:hypothetical protein
MIQTQKPKEVHFTFCLLFPNVYNRGGLQHQILQQVDKVQWITSISVLVI